jgi:hypothetical protein
MDATDLIIAGWSRGMLVRFQIRDGRLCIWSQRSGSAPDATDALAATPLPGAASRHGTLTLQPD